VSRNLTAFAWIAGSLLFICGSRADVVYLKGAGKLEGRIVERTETSIEVDIGAGTMTVPMSRVERVEEGRSPLDDYRDRAAALDAADTEGWLELARWASVEGLRTQSRQAYERVLAVDPQNAEANRSLGRVELEGRWVSEEESYRARGYVEFEGQWMTPADREVILNERAARAQAQRARIEADSRVREAEARAREAEAAAAAAAAEQTVVGVPVWWGPWGPGPERWPQPPARPQPRPLPSRVPPR
jgi:hypothetical protein